MSTEYSVLMMEASEAVTMKVQELLEQNYFWSVQVVSSALVIDDNDILSSWL